MLCPLDAHSLCGFWTKRASVLVKPMISVCHIASDNEWGGAEAQIAMLLAELSQMRDFSVSAIILGEGRLASELRNRGVEVEVVKQAEGRFLHCYWAARRL